MLSRLLVQNIRLRFSKLGATGLSEKIMLRADGPLIERILRAPLQARKVRVFTFLLRPVDFGGFPLHTALFLVPLLLQTRFLTVPLSGCGFACSSDDVLLLGATRLGQAIARWHRVCGEQLTPWTQVFGVPLSRESERVYRGSIPDLRLR